MLSKLKNSYLEIKVRNLDNLKFFFVLAALFIFLVLAVHPAFIKSLVHDEYRFYSPIASFGNASNTPDTLSSAYFGSGRFISGVFLELLQLFPIRTFEELISLKIFLFGTSAVAFSVALFKYKSFFEKNNQITCLIILSLFFSKGLWIGIYWLPALSMYLSSLIAIIFAIDISSDPTKLTIKQLIYYSVVILSIYPSSLSIFYITYILFVLNDVSISPKDLFLQLRGLLVAFLGSSLILYITSKVLLKLFPGYVSIASNFGGISVSNIFSIRRYLELSRIAQELLQHPFSVNYSVVETQESQSILFLILLTTVFLISIYILLSITSKNWYTRLEDIIVIVLSGILIIFFLNLHLIPSKNFVAGFRNVVGHEIFLFTYLFIFVKKISLLFTKYNTTVFLIFSSFLLSSFMFIKLPERRLSVIPFNLEYQLAANKINDFYLVNNRLPTRLHVVTTITSRPGINGSLTTDSAASYDSRNYIGLPIFKESIFNSTYPEYNSQSFAEEPFVLVSYILNTFEPNLDICDVNLQTAPIRFGRCNDDSIRVSYTGMKDQSNLVNQNYNNSELTIDFHDIQNTLENSESYLYQVPKALEEIMGG